MLGIKKNEPTSEDGVTVSTLIGSNGNVLVTIAKRMKDLGGLECFGPHPMEVSINGSEWVAESELSRLLRQM